MKTTPLAAIEEGVKLVPELKDKLAAAVMVGEFSLNHRQVMTVLAALTAAGELVKPYPGVLLNDIRTIADTGGRRIETAMDACDKIVELIDMERQLGPASPVGEDVVEKGGCKMAWKQGFCYGDPEYYPPPSASTGKDGDYYMSTDEDAEQESLEIDEFPLEDR